MILESFRGDARITGGDTQSVKVNGRKSIRAFQQPDADRANNDTPVELIQQGEDMIVRTNQDRVSDSGRVKDELEITVPRGASVEAHGRFGDLDITDLTGSVDIDSDNAGVRVQNIAGKVRVDVRKSDVVRAVAVKGKVELKGHGNDIELQDISGPVTIDGTWVGQVQFRNLAQPLRYDGATLQLSLEKLPGQVRFEPGELTGANIVGPIRLTANSTDVQLTGFTQALNVNLSRTGNVDLRPGAQTPKMDVHTNSGDIDLSLPATARVDLRLSTERGDAENDYGAPFKAESDNRGAVISGGAGTGPQLRLTTGHGHITLHKGSGEPDTDVRSIPKPPEPPPAPLKPQEQ